MPQFPGIGPSPKQAHPIIRPEPAKTAVGAYIIFRPWLTHSSHQSSRGVQASRMIVSARSTLIPNSLMSGHHFAAPAFCRVASVFGVCRSRGSSSARDRRSAIAPTTALSLLAVSRGVPFEVRKPVLLLASGENPRQGSSFAGTEPTNVSSIHFSERDALAQRENNHG